MPEESARPAPQWYEEWACRLTDAGNVEVVCPVCSWTCLLNDAGFGWMERHWAEEHTHA